MKYVAILSVLMTCFSAESYFASNTKGLICYYYKLYQDPNSSQFGGYDGSWLYATTPDNAYVKLETHFENGFLVANTSAKEAEDYCVQSIRKRVGSGYKLLTMTAGAGLGYSETPLAFSDTASKIIIFGDSMSDTGNIYKWTLKTYPAQPYFMGRFSNGPMWADYLPMINGAKISISNWSSGGATAHPRELGPYRDYDFLRDLRNRFTGHLEDNVGSYIRSLHSHRILHPQDYTFLFWLGANDLGWGTKREKIAHSIENQIRRLAKMGAVHFAVLNSLNCDYSQYKNTHYCGYDEDERRKLRSMGYSQAEDWVEGTVQHLNRELGGIVESLYKSGIKVSLIDINEAHERMINNLAPILFGATTKFGYGFNAEYDQRCFSGNWDSGSKNPKADTCSHLSRAFYYDQSHPASFAHCWLSLFIQEGLYNSGFLGMKPDLDVYKKTCDSP